MSPAATQTKKSTSKKAKTTKKTGTKTGAKSTKSSAKTTISASKTAKKAPKTTKKPAKTAVKSKKTTPKKAKSALKPTKKQGNLMDKLADSIAHPQRLEALLGETETELQALQPEIEALEKKLERLQTLKHTKQKLITLKLSIQSILKNFETPEPLDYGMPTMAPTLGSAPPKAPRARHGRDGDAWPDQQAVFSPEEAMEEVDTILRRKNSLNYVIYQAMVEQGGRTTTEAIRDYLVEYDIRQPQSNRSFEDAPLTDISSRINYLVRKGVVRASGGGEFITTYGWQNP